MMEFNITGIDAQAKKQCDTFRTLRPVGAVRLVHDTENAYDKFAIGIWFNDVRLGYVPGQKVGKEYVGSELQKRILSDKITTAKVVGYSYTDTDNETWNNEHKGRLGSVRLEIGVQDVCSPAIGGDYMRVTEFIGYLNPYGKSDGLIKWAYTQGDTYEKYAEALDLTAQAGTALHSYIEAELMKKPVVGDAGRFSHGWEKFKEKYTLDTIRMEERFYDSTLMVTGQPDWFGYCNGKLMVLDWKSGKKPSLKHKMQLAIYAKNCQFDGIEADGAMVVCFGSDNKQGFATSCMTKEQIDTYYEAMKHLRKVIDAVAYVSRDKMEG